MQNGQYADLLQRSLLWTMLICLASTAHKYYLSGHSNEKIKTFLGGGGPKYTERKATVTNFQLLGDHQMFVGNQSLYPAVISSFNSSPKSTKICRPHV
jgi:hypothetical protein